MVFLFSTRFRIGLPTLAARANSDIGSEKADPSRRRIALRSSLNHKGLDIKKNLDTLLLDLPIPPSTPPGVLSGIGVLRIVVAGFIHLNRESDIGSYGCEGAVGWFLVQMQSP